MPTKYYLAIAVCGLLLTACHDDDSGTSTPPLAPTNEAPTASNILITDSNGGGAEVGDSLSGSYQYADTEGDAEAASQLRWLRDGSPISGATDNTYTLMSADAGTDISFQVTPVASAGTIVGNPQTSASVTIATPNQIPTATNVNIIDNNGGDAEMGDQLSGNYQYNDVDGDTEGSSTFRWLRDGSAIGDATAQTYIIDAADLNSDLSFEVTPIASSGTSPGNPVVSNTITVVDNNEAPTATNVTISDDNGGDVEVGDQLTGHYIYNDADGDVEGVSIYQWLLNGTPITGATALTYLVTASDSNNQITFQVTPIADTGASPGNTVTSSPINVSDAAPEAINVIITDNNGDHVIVGDSLTGSYTYSDAESDPEGSTQLAWFRNNNVIGGQTTNTYVLQQADLGQNITFRVTPRATSGTLLGNQVASAPVVPNQPPPLVTLLSRFLDSNLNDVMDAGDEVIVHFDQDVVVNGALPQDFQLPVNSNDFGSGATVSAGPRTNEVTITLGTNPIIVVGGDFNTPNTSNGSPSGIDISSTPAGDVIENGDGIDAEASTPVDIVPGLVESEQVFTVGQSFFSPLAVGDLDGVNGPDFIIRGAIYRNDGSGQFTGTPSTIITGTKHYQLGDIDSDGDLDLLITDAQANFARTYINDGNGNFSLSQTLNSSPNQKALLVDVDGDSDLDALVPITNGDVQLFFNDGVGTYTFSHILAAAERANSALCTGDVNGDGNADLATANSNQVMKTWINNGDGTFALGQTLTSGTHRDCAFADFDNDGDDDLVDLSTGFNRFYRNDAGTLVDSGQTLCAEDCLSSPSEALAVGDMDGDGDLDLVFAEGAGSRRLLINDGNANFTDARILNDEGDARYIGLADVDGDGDLDVLTSESFSGSAVKAHLHLNSSQPLRL